MADASSAPEQSSPDVMEVAERHGLGDYRRTLIPRKRRLLRGGVGEATGFLHDFENGVIYQGIDDDGRVFVYPWDKVVRVYVGSTRNYVNGMYSGTDYSYTLILADGGKLTMSGEFRDPAIRHIRTKHEGDEYEIFMLMSAAATAVSQAQLPDAMARLERGEALAFGEMKISKFGVRTEERLLPWNTIKGVQVNQGIIQFRQSGKFFALSRQSLSQIPNVPLFFMLVDAFHGK